VLYKYASNFSQGLRNSLVPGRTLKASVDTEKDLNYGLYNVKTSNFIDIVKTEAIKLLNDDCKAYAGILTRPIGRIEEKLGIKTK